MILSLYREDEDQEEEEISPIIALSSLPIEEDTLDEILVAEPSLTTANGCIKARIIRKRN